MGAVVELLSRRRQLSQLAHTSFAYPAPKRLAYPRHPGTSVVVLSAKQTYQIPTTLAYQQHIARNLTQRYHQLNAEVERIVNDADTRIQALETRNQELTGDRQSLDQKYAQLLDQYQEKSKKQAQTQKLYDTLKQKVMLEEMEPLADNDVTQTLQSISALPQSEMRQPATDSRQAFRPPDHLQMAERPTPRYNRLQEGPERLHPHQRSGSIVSGRSEQRGMLPPERLRMLRIPNMVATSGTPLQRTASPAQPRPGVNQSGIPATGSHSPLPDSHHLLGSSRHQHNHSSKVANATLSYSAISSGMKVGRAGTSGSIDLGPRFNKYAGRSDLPRCTLETDATWTKSYMRRDGVQIMQVWLHRTQLAMPEFTRGLRYDQGMQVMRTSPEKMSKQSSP
ncbi:hypothetical protein CLAIMM_09831 [Cladophialophora immunda]|nr:hypothetical protein CLAIMM_09831 [Cladophialophora immunda]